MQLLEKDANIGTPMPGDDFRGTALFSPIPGLLLAVKYRRTPGGYHQRFGLLLTHESYKEYCFGRFEALPDPFEDLDSKEFDTIETPDPISLERHIQYKYKRSVLEQHQIWFDEDLNKIANVQKGPRPQLLEKLLAAYRWEAGRCC